MGIKSIEMNENDRLIIDLPDVEHRVLIELNEGNLVVGNDKCRHRGGPLHLCYRDSAGKRRCPWHDRPVLKVDKSEEVCCVFILSKQQINIVRSRDSSGPWPVRKISND